MTTTELERGTTEKIEVDDNDSPDDINAHLYANGGERQVALCGIVNTQDKHHGCHPEVHWAKGMMACPKCGAPLCMTCLLEAS